VRYADDFVIFCESKEDAEKAEMDANNWLKTRGLEISNEKTRIAHLTEGFDFLGFNIRHYKVSNTKTGYKLLIKPSQELLQRTRKELREIFLAHKGAPVGALIAKINPIIRGKANYLRIGVSAKAFKEFDDYLFKRQIRYTNQTHPNKSNGWKRSKYWGRLNLQKPNEKWVFGDKNSGAFMLKFRWFRIQRHPMVTKTYSPDDPLLREYWEKRQRKQGRSEAQKLNRTQQIVARRQDYKCPICGQSIFNDEPLHLHHIKPRCEGGKDTVKNLVWLHQYCHHKVHYQTE
jgi:RNA-directed DNA polymerase